jgi:uncharacterized protein (TIGR03083 family)
MAFEVPLPDRLVGIDVGAVYRETRERIAVFLSGATDEMWERPVPHCSEWTVRETVAHLSGVVDDAINGNMEGVASDAWTAKQVTKRADMSGPTIVEEWLTYGPFVDARATEVGLALHQLLFDVVNHEHDIRFAIGEPGARDSDAVWIGAHFVASRMPAMLKEKGSSAIALIVDGIAMTSPADVELHTSAFDLIRLACGRRSVEQISQMEWIGNASNHFDKVFAFTPPEVGFNE